MALYIISSPEYDTQYFGPSYPETGGPVETGSDFWAVDAPTARAAKWACHRSPKRGYDPKDYDRHPLTGYVATKITQSNLDGDMTLDDFRDGFGGWYIDDYIEEIR